MLCADLVDVKWKDAGGRTHRAVANLEDISVSGACIQVDKPIPLHSTLHISYPKGEMQGRVCYCIYRDIGYFIGVQFEKGSKWNIRQYRPQHYLDPRMLVLKAVGRSRQAFLPDAIKH